MNKQYTYRGPSGMFLLFLTFLILKLTNFIDWSWWWITIPLWGPPVFVITLVIIILLVASIVVLIDALINK